MVRHPAGQFLNPDFFFNGPRVGVWSEAAEQGGSSNHEIKATLWVIKSGVWVFLSTQERSWRFRQQREQREYNTPQERKEGQI
jgi:hypothetical protein